jgi:hypothetical protein
VRAAVRRVLGDSRYAARAAAVAGQDGSARAAAELENWAP